MGLADRVRFLGEIPPDEVRAVMRFCDVFVFPSVYEAMPLALVEAMAAGMPIVASDIPANREVLSDTGILTPPDSYGLARAAKRLLEDPNLANEMGRKAAQRAKLFSLDNMVDHYADLLASEMAA